MRVALFAHSTVGARTFRALLDLGHTVAALFTHPREPEEGWFTPVEAEARAAGVPVHLIAPRVRPGPRLAETLRALGLDLVLSAYSKTILPGEALSAAPLGAFNIHGSLLPRYRGRSPVHWAIIRGEKETGVTLHHMSARPDEGDVVGQARIPIGPEDTALTVLKRVEEGAEELLRLHLDAIGRGEAPRRRQDLRQGERFGGRTPRDGLFEWTWPAARIHDLVRATTHPFPGAFTRREGRRLFIWRSRPLPLAAAPAGAGFSPAPGRFAVGTGGGALEVLIWSIDDGPDREGGELAGIF